MVMAMVVPMAVTMIVNVIVSVIVCVVVAPFRSMAVTMIVAASMISVVASQMVVSISGVQNLDLNQIENQADNCHDQHDPSFHLWWLKEPLGSFHTQPDGHDPHRGNRNESTNDFSTMPSIREGISLTDLCHFECNH